MDHWMTILVVVAAIALYAVFLFAWIGRSLLRAVYLHIDGMRSIEASLKGLEHALNAIRKDLQEQKRPGEGGPYA